jgi:hypothetical protein
LTHESTTETGNLVQGAPMTLARLIPLHVHGALEAALAVVIMATPLVFGFDTAAMLVTFGVGALLFGIALATTASGRSALPISTHASLDIAMAFAMAVGAVTLALGDDRWAAALLATGALALILLTSLTRWSEAPA